MVNVFRHGSLVMQQANESSVLTTGSILYGTVDGAIGKYQQSSCILMRTLKLLLYNIQKNTEFI